MEGFAKDEFFAFAHGVRIFLTCALRSFDSVRKATDWLVFSRGMARQDAFRYLSGLRQDC